MQLLPPDAFLGRTAKMQLLSGMRAETVASLAGSAFGPRAVYPAVVGVRVHTGTGRVSQGGGDGPIPLRVETRSLLGPFL